MVLYTFGLVRYYGSVHLWSCLIFWFCTPLVLFDIMVLFTYGLAGYYGSLSILCLARYYGSLCILCIARYYGSLYLMCLVIMVLSSSSILFVIMVLSIDSVFLGIMVLFTSVHFGIIVFSTLGMIRYYGFLPIRSPAPRICFALDDLYFLDF